MSKTIVVCGFGPGISTAVAERFGREGFSVALVARNAERLDAGVRALEAKGVRAAAFPADLADPAAAASAVAQAQVALGPVAAIHWNAYSGQAGDLLTADASEVRNALDVAVTGLLAVVRAAHGDLKAAKGAILVTNGGFGRIAPAADAMCVTYGAMGLGLANAAKAKLVGLLAERLKGDGIYVGELTIMGTVKGTAFDSGAATLEAANIAERFWSLYTSRSTLRAELA